MLEHRTPQRILDVGCGPGWLANALTACGHEVTGVDVAEESGVHERMERFLRADLATGLPDELDDDYDVVVAADVVEHLADPSRLLYDMADRVRPGGSVIASVPNIGHWYPRARVAAGRFDYDQRGILDSTHLRFFTRRSFLRLAGEAGLRPTSASHTGLPLDAMGLSDTQPIARAIGSIDRALVRLWPTLFAYQFVFEFAVSRPEPLGDMPAHD
jgi:SAM-dependent methyltransferase